MSGPRSAISSLGSPPTHLATILAVLCALACGDDDGPAPTDAGSPDVGTDAHVDVDTGPVGPSNPLDGIGEPEVVGDTGFFFLEGPHWREAEGVLLFSDVAGNTIWELTPPSEFRVFRAESNGANGLATDGNGFLLVAEHGGRVSRTLADGTIETVADSYMGDALSSPNDLAVRSDGTIYFTDPPFGLGGRTQELPFNGVFRVAPSGELSVEWEGPPASRPNGLIFSPDERTLYVADSAAGSVRRYDVAADGSLSGESDFATDTPFANGMAVDEEGNLYVATTMGVKVYAPDGELWGTLALPHQPANCTFGGADRRSFYVTARATLYRVTATIPGR